jgi:hypothetical protein
MYLPSPDSLSESSCRISSSLERPDIYSSESAMLVVVAGGERAEAILLLASKCSFPEDKRASAALRFLVRGGMVKVGSAKERGVGATP